MMATMLDRTIEAPLLLVEFSRICMNGNVAWDFKIAVKSPAVKRKAISIANPRTPLMAMAKNMECGTTTLLFATSSAICAACQF